MSVTTVDPYLAHARVRVKLCALRSHEFLLDPPLEQLDLLPVADLDTKSLPLDVRLGEIFTDPRAVVAADGATADPNEHLCVYLQRTDGRMYVRTSDVALAPAMSMRPGPPPLELARVSPHGYLFALQQRLKAATGAACRVTFPPDVRFMALRLRSIGNVLDILGGTVSVAVWPPQSLTVKLQDGASLSLDSSNFSMADDGLVASRQLVASLREFVRLSETPEDRRNAELQAVAGYMREQLASRQLAPDLLAVADNKQFIDRFVAEYVSEDRVRMQAAVQWPAVQQWAPALASLRRYWDVVCHYTLRVFSYMTDHGLLFYYLHALINVPVFLIFGGCRLYCAMLVGAAVLCTAAALVKDHFGLDVYDWVVANMLPVVYPPELASAEVEKFLPALLATDEELSDAAVAAAVDRLRLRPEALKVLCLCVLSVTSPFLAMWKDRTEMRRAALVSTVRTALDKERQKRREIANE